MLAALKEKSYERLRSVANSFLAGRFPTIRNKPDEVAYYQTFRAVFRKELSAKVLEKLDWPAEVVKKQMLQTAELCEMLYQFYAEYETRILAEKNLRGILEYNDVRSMLYRMLATEDGNSSEFARSLASQYDAVYIDEYQDVDLLQDRIFALIGETRRFMVGDIKQSIYGFRGSDPSIFASYRRNMPLHTEKEAEQADGICVFMSENFRCNRSVIEFANRICGFLFSACEKSVGYRPQDDLVCSKLPALKDGEPVQAVPVQVAVFDASPKKGSEGNDAEAERDEAKWTAAEISRLLREERLDNGSPITPSDITILVRNKAHGTEFAKALEALGIPVTSDTSTDFLNEPLMTDTLNLLRTLDNPYRDLPLSEFLLSPFGRFSLEEMSEIRKAIPNQHALYDAFLEKAKQEDPLGQKCKHLLLWMQRMQETAQTLPADRFLRKLYLEAPFAPYSQDPILLFLYEQARLYQRSSWCGLYGFLSHMDRMLEGQKVSASGLVKAEKSVTVMTVHHSKGLEFPVVFLSACGAAFNRSDLRDTLMFHKSVGCASKLYNKETGERENTLLRELVKQELDLEQTEESIRTLYVALTRARERLYVTGTLRGKWDTTLANASVVRRGNRSAILSCNSYLAWILSAWQEAERQNAEFPCIFQHISPEEVADGVPFAKKATQKRELTEAPESVSASAKQYANICNRHKSYSYPLGILHTLPTKAAASKLRPDLLDLL
ncbi:MAG: UvrD-helicase domain-containing protein, partial [Clostridia bacterium]|nr:UvrD-helicase domain-containing protein [Clostridia bacterium]